MKAIDFRVYLDEGSAEFYLDHIWYYVEFDIYDNFCAIDKLKIYCDNEECELELMSKEDLELLGIDEKFKEWICDQIDYEIRWELETRFYEEYPLLARENEY